MVENVIRFCDYERRSKQPDAMQPRNPCEADVIVLPVVRIERFDDAPFHATTMAEHFAVRNEP